MHVVVLAEANYCWLPGFLLRLLKHPVKHYWEQRRHPFFQISK